MIIMFMLMTVLWTAIGTILIYQTSVMFDQVALENKYFNLPGLLIASVVSLTNSVKLIVTSSSFEIKFLKF